MVARPVDEWIEDVVERLVRQFRPLKIILFGSRARADEREGSDVDLLVVLPRVEDKREAALAMRRALDGIHRPVAVQLFASDPDELERSSDSVGSFLYPVLREGKVIYGVDDRDEHVWLRYAEEDLRAAERMTSERGWTPRIACFHAQQAAGKALNAVLVADGRPLVFTHNLEVLRDAVSERRRVGHVGVDLKSLSAWATLPRYPGAVPHASPEDARAAVAAAQTVVEAAREDVARVGSRARSRTWLKPPQSS